VSGNIEEKLVFGISPTDTGADLLLGIPAGAWEYMKDGKTHHLDLSRLGIPIRIILYGAATHDAAMKHVEEHNRSLGLPILDERRTDFGIKPKAGH
jgi:hypothetical protein